LGKAKKKLERATQVVSNDGEEFVFFRICLNKLFIFKFYFCLVPLAVRDINRN